MNIINYIYYRLYQLMITVGNKDVPEIAALFLMAMLFGLNFFSITSVSYLIGYKIDLGLDTGLKIGTFYFSFSLILYIILIHNKKFLKIAKSYENETDKDKKWGQLFAISYFILSIGLMIFCFYMMIKKNRGEL